LKCKEQIGTFLLDGGLTGDAMVTCRVCGKSLPERSRFCTQCGRPVAEEASAPVRTPPAAAREAEQMNLMVLYIMIVALIVAVLFPPWETASEQGPQFLGFHFILSPPDSEGRPAVISRLLITIELVTLAVAGLYFSWLFRKKPNS
jgi:hypothetical protein